MNKARHALLRHRGIAPLKDHRHLESARNLAPRVIVENSK